MDRQETQHYNLKWNNFKDNLLQIFAEQLDRELLTDVIISCEGKLIKAHRIVLSACSIYFQNLFEVYAVPNPLIILSGVKLDDLKQILTFMYLGEIRVSEQNMGAILALANDLQVKGLSNVVYSNILEQKRTIQMKSEEIAQSMASNQTLGIQRSLSSNHELPRRDHPVDLAPNNYSAQSRHSESPASCTDSNFSDTVKPARPPIAFMIFANEWRAKLSEKYPEDNNKEISVRLSTMWKSMRAQQKAKYYYLAKKTQPDKQTNYNHPLSVRKKEERQRLKKDLRKPDIEDDRVSSIDSSDGLEIVEEETELIEIKEDTQDSRESVQTNNHQVPGTSLSTHRQVTHI